MDLINKFSSGISIREEQAKLWLTAKKFKGEYLLVSTKPDSIYSKKLAELKPSQRLIVDLYTPIFLEKELTLSKWKPQDWLTQFRNKEMVKKFLRRGNHFLVANYRQREYWLKTAQSLGVALEVNDISVLPTGSGKVQRSTFNVQRSIKCNVVLWFGGIYPWMNPTLLIEAFAQVSSKFPDWKLRFLGGFHPDTGYKNLYQKIELVAKSKISNDQLEFIPWQSEKNLNKYFADVAFAVHLPKATLEDYYAHRVRLLTLLSAGIPVLTTGQDVVSEAVEKCGAGKIINPVLESLSRELIELLESSDKIKLWQRNTRKVENYILSQNDDKHFRKIFHNFR